MNQGNKPRAREKRVDQNGAGVHIREGEQKPSTGPVNNTGNYADRKETAKPAGSSRPATSTRPVNGNQNTRPGPFGNNGSSGAPFTQQSPFGNGNTASSSRPATQNRPNSYGAAQQSRPTSGYGTAQQSRPASGYGTSQQSRPASGYNQTQHRTTTTTSRPASARPSTTGNSAGSSGGGSKFIAILVALAVLVFGGKSLLGGDETVLPTQTGTTGTTGTVQTQTSSNQSGSNTYSSNTSANGIADLLSSLMGSGSSAYDFSGILGSTSTTAAQSTDYLPAVSQSASSGNTAKVDTTVAKSARKKFTKILGKGNDTITLMVYMCGTDLESQNGMGTADLKEMTKATIGSNINLLVYTGGCKSWRNNVVSSSVNQIYRISDGKLERLEADMGSLPMTQPSVLTQFIRYCAEKYPANRYDLIFWDHGGGSVSGYGYDEKYASSGSMSLAGIDKALKDAGIQFDFIGFDACLMATVENGLMLSQYADYMIASEESEPGVGWYYTNWLTKLSENPSMKTTQIGKLIVDDFIEVCDKTCRGQATTLSVVDLAELAATVPAELTEFSKATNELIQNQQYKTVSKARSSTREFAQSSRIDQIDLIHFAKNLGNDAGKELAEALTGAVKYNRTSGGMTNAYGLSIYFPYKKVSNVSKAVNTFSAIGMDSEYLRCIQEFASMEASGQAVGSGYTGSTGYTGYTGSTSGQDSLSGLLGSLLGGSGSSAYSSPSSGNDMMSLLGGLFSGGDFFSGRTLDANQTAQYLSENLLDASELYWQQNGDGYGITLSDSQWSTVDSLVLNVFYDTGKGYVDLGMDNVFDLNGNTLVGSYDGTWISINGQPVAYYYMNTVEEGDDYAITGYVPVMLNGNRANLILVFDTENPYGCITGAQTVYRNGETETVAKSMISVGAGDKVDFICDFYGYDGSYQDSYYLGETMTLGSEVRIANTEIESSRAKATYCFTDIYQARYWTPAIP